MAHETSLIATIAVGLAFAFVGGFAAARVGLPPLVGYLLAGIAVGPFTPGFVADTKLAPRLAEIGVILLMFGGGMHFSVRELWAVRAVAVPGAIAQIAVATGLHSSLTRPSQVSFSDRQKSIFILRPSTSDVSTRPRIGVITCKSGVT